MTGEPQRTGSFFFSRLFINRLFCRHRITSLNIYILRWGYFVLQIFWGFNSASADTQTFQTSSSVAKSAHLMNKSHFPWRYAVWRLSVSTFLVIWKGFLHILDLGLVFTRPWGLVSTSLNLRREEQLRITEVNLNLLFCCGHANPTSCWARGGMGGGAVKKGEHICPNSTGVWKWQLTLTTTRTRGPGRARSVRISWHARGLFEARFVKSSVKRRKK